MRLGRRSLAPLPPITPATIRAPRLPLRCPSCCMADDVAYQWGRSGLWKARREWRGRVFVGRGDSWRRALCASRPGIKPAPSILQAVCGGAGRPRRLGAKIHACWTDQASGFVRRLQNSNQSDAGVERSQQARSVVHGGKWRAPAQLWPSGKPAHYCMLPSWLITAARWAGSGHLWKSQSRAQPWQPAASCSFALQCISSG